MFKWFDLPAVAATTQQEAMTSRKYCHSYVLIVLLINVI